MIISSCTKEQQQDIWCNTIAGSVPRGVPSALCSETTGVFNSAAAFVRSVAPSATLASRRAQSAASRGCLCVHATGFIPTVSNSCAGVSLSESWLHAVEELAPSGGHFPLWLVWLVRAVVIERFVVVCLARGEARCTSERLRSPPPGGTRVCAFVTVKNVRSEFG